MKKRVFVVSVIIILVLLTIAAVAIRMNTDENESNLDEMTSSSEQSSSIDDAYRADLRNPNDTHRPELNSVDTIGTPEMVTFLDNNTYTPRNTIVVSNFVEALRLYTKSETKYSPQTITIRPQSLRIENNLVRGVIQFDHTGLSFPFEIATFISKSTLPSTIIKVNPENINESTAFVHISGIQTSQDKKFTISQENTTSTNLTITATDKEAALKYLSSLGYRVPDFSITFINYTDPF